MNFYGWDNAGFDEFLLYIKCKSIVDKQLCRLYTADIENSERSAKVEKFIVSRNDCVYEAWPDLVQTASGALLCVFTECVHHADRTGSRLMLTRSTDRGRTWSEKIPLTEKAPDKEHRLDCARISRLPDNTLVIVCDYVVGEEDDGYAEIWLWRGDAEGTRFVGPEITPAKGIVPTKLTVTKTGRWLLGAHYYEKEIGKLVQYVWYSDDGGKTWSGRITAARDARYNLCEGDIAVLDDNTLVMLLRENSGLGYDCMKVISYDNGETWTGVYPLPLPGCHGPVSLLLPNGECLVTYRFMQGGKGWLGWWTQNFFAALISQDDLRETDRIRQGTRILPVDFDRSPVSDLGYSGSVCFDDGEIYVVSYIVDDAPNAHIRGYSLRRSDFIFD